MLLFIALAPYIGALTASVIDYSTLSKVEKTIIFSKRREPNFKKSKFLSDFDYIDFPKAALWQVFGEVAFV
jgi:hypothetical protein